MKRFFSLTLMLIFLFSLTACNLDAMLVSSENPQSSDNSKTYTEKELKEMVVGTEGKTAFEVLEELEEIGFQLVCRSDGHTLYDFDTHAYYLAKDAYVSYSLKEISLTLTPVDMYQYSGYEERMSEIGDIIEFGLYAQDYDKDSNDSDGKKPIKWVVLDTDGSKYLLCSLYILDNQDYNDTIVAESATWESCSLRSWLNDTFIDEAFTQEEQSAIVSTSIENHEKNSLYNSSGVNTTQDKIFLLSYDEAWQYFNDASSRQAAGTPCARVNKLFVSKQNGMSAWWLRTPESSLYKYVVNSGGQHENSPRVNESEGVRPVLWIDMDLMR